MAKGVLGVRKRLVVVAVVAVAVVLVSSLVVIGRSVWERLHRTDFQIALGSVPANSLRVSYTDWAVVRHRLGLDLGAEPSPGQVDKLMSRAYDLDLSAASSLSNSAPALQSKYGFSPANASWEAYAQSRAGATMVMAMPKGTDFGLLAQNLRSLGYGQPRGDTGVWTGGVDLVSSIDISITPELQYVVLLKKQRLVVTSDTSSYAATSANVAQGHADSLTSSGPMKQLAGRVGEPAAAVVWAGDFACADLAMSKADAASQRQADQLVARVGGVSPLSGLILAMGADRRLTVAEQFDSSDQADRNLRPRAQLAAGEAVGRGGSFSDQFKLTSTKAVGSTDLLVLTPKASTGYVLSALYDGPLIFATC